MIFWHSVMNSEGQIVNSYIAIYELEKETWRFPEGLTQQHPCFVGEVVVIGETKSLPNGLVGFILRCLPRLHGENAQPAPVRPEIYYLYSWDETTDSMELLFDFQENFIDNGEFVYDFSISPDMAEMVYVRGTYISGNLYHVKGIEEIVPLVPHFFRVTEVEWAPDGTTIAFLGVETLSGTQPEDIISFAHTLEINRHPKDLFLLDMQGASPRKVAGGFTSATRFQWLPHSSRYIVMASYYRSVPGIWLIDTQTGKLTRLWDTTEQFGLTPDGRQLAIYDGYERVFSTMNGLDTVEEWTLLIYDSERIVPVPTAEP